MKVHLITHNDLDAAGCAIIMKDVGFSKPGTELMEIDLDVQYNSYQTIDGCIRQTCTNITNEDIMIIADICPSEGLLDELHKKPFQKYLVDHHDSKAHLNGRYPWVIIKESTCGMAMLYSALLNKQIPHLRLFPLATDTLAKMTELVAWVDDYDHFRNEFPQSRQLNVLLGLIGKDLFVRQTSLCFTEILFDYKEIIKIQEDSDAAYLKTGLNRVKIDTRFDTIVGSRRVGFVYAERCISLMGEYILENRPDIDVVAIINMSTQQVSVRSRKDTLTNDISLARGGGGHPNAHGFPVSDKKAFTLWNIIAHDSNDWPNAG